MTRTLKPTPRTSDIMNRLAADVAAEKGWSASDSDEYACDLFEAALRADSFAGFARTTFLGFNRYLIADEYSRTHRLARRWYGLADTAIQSATA